MPRTNTLNKKTKTPKTNNKHKNDDRNTTVNPIAICPQSPCCLLSYSIILSSHTCDLQACGEEIMMRLPNLKHNTLSKPPRLKRGAALYGWTISTRRVAQPACRLSFQSAPHLAPAPRINTATWPNKAQRRHPAPHNLRTRRDGDWVSLDCGTRVWTEVVQSGCLK